MFNQNVTNNPEAFSEEATDFLQVIDAEAKQDAIEFEIWKAFGFSDEDAWELAIRRTVKPLMTDEEAMLAFL